jgi:rhamnosyltransferase
MEAMGLKRCLAVVVVYHPNWEDLCRNMETYPQGVEKIVVVANSPLDAEQQAFLLEKGIQLIQNPDNRGVATALNQAAELALDEGFDWLLTMDQDSRFGPTQGHALQQAMHLAPPQTAAIGVESLKTPELVPRFVPVAFLLQSGTLFNLPAWKALGGFAESLFIDAVDHEYCLRAKKAGYRIFEYPSIQLIHQLGQTLKLPKWLFIFHSHPKAGISYHSPARERFIFRNNAWLIRQYFWPFPAWATRRIGYLSLRVIYALILLPEKGSRLKNIFSGLRESFGFMG